MKLTDIDFDIDFIKNFKLYPDKGSRWFCLGNEFLIIDYNVDDDGEFVNLICLDDFCEYRYELHDLRNLNIGGQIDIDNIKEVHIKYLNDKILERFERIDSINTQIYEMEEKIKSLLED